MTTARVAIVALIVSILLLIGYYFKGCKPTNEKIQQAEKLLTEKKAEFEKQNKVVQDMPRFEKELQQIERRFEEAKSQLPNTSQIPDLLKDISKKAKDAGLSFELFNLLPESIEGFYAQVPVQMSIVGQYHNVAIFFDEISKLSRIINISDLEATPVKTGDGEIMLKAQCTATTFKFVSEEEAQRAQQQQQKRRRK